MACDGSCAGVCICPGTRPQNEWQPIETAPKDGTPVHLGFAHMAGFDVIAHWEGDDWALTGEGDNAVRLHGRGDPSAWMPLPEPPVE